MNLNLLVLEKVNLTMPDMINHCKFSKLGLGIWAVGDVINDDDNKLKTIFHAKYMHVRKPKT